MTYVLIKVKMKSKFGGKITNGKAIVKDGVSLTTYDDPNINKRSFKAMQKQGKECGLENGVLIERYHGDKKEKIVEKIITDIKNFQVKFKKVLDLNYKMEVMK